MIKDSQKWSLGVSMLGGFAQHLPSSPDEEAVGHFHKILSILQEASGEDLSAFGIPVDKLERRVTSVTRGGYGGGSRVCDLLQEEILRHQLLSFTGAGPVLSGGARLLCSTRRTWRQRRTLMTVKESHLFSSPN